MLQDYFDKNLSKILTPRGETDDNRDCMYSLTADDNQTSNQGTLC